MKTIVFSLLCHENIDCIKDLIFNIKLHSCNFKTYILITSKQIIYQLRDTYDFDESVIIVNVRNNENIWGKMDIFQKHIIHMKYLYDNNIHFDYFWFLANNECFIKNISNDFLENNVIKIHGNKNDDPNYDNYYNNFVNSDNDWIWFNEMRKDNNTLNIFKNNRLYFYEIIHESIVLTNGLVHEIMSFFINNRIYEDSSYRNYCMEEIFIKSYILSKYNTSDLHSFCHRFYYEDDLMSKYKNQECDSLYNIFMNEYLTITVKPVYLDYNNSLRSYIRNKSNNILTEFSIGKLNLNQYYYSKSLSSCLFIDNDKVIHFSKLSKELVEYSWIGYDIVGNHNYKLSFDLYTNKNINNFNFIKIHNPVTFYNTNTHIQPNQWNYIEVIINISSDLDFLCFIFDDYNDSINLKFRNISFDII